MGWKEIFVCKGNVIGVDKGRLVVVFKSKYGLYEVILLLFSYVSDSKLDLFSCNYKTSLNKCTFFCIILGK